jgi:hypothetical protein
MEILEAENKALTEAIEKATINYSTLQQASKKEIDDLAPTLHDTNRIVDLLKMSKKTLEEDISEYQRKVENLNA